MKLEYNDNDLPIKCINFSGCNNYILRPRNGKYRILLNSGRESAIQYNSIEEILKLFDLKVIETKYQF